MLIEEPVKQTFGPNTFVMALRTRLAQEDQSFIVNVSSTLVRARQKGGPMVPVFEGEPVYMGEIIEPSGKYGMLSYVIRDGQVEVQVIGPEEWPPESSNVVHAAIMAAVEDQKGGRGA